MNSGFSVKGLKLVFAAVLLKAALPAPLRYELRGTVPAAGAGAAVSLADATSSYTATAQTGTAGSFRFRQVPGGTYAITVELPDRRLLRQTVIVSPSLADASGVIQVGLTAPPQPRRRAGTISLRQLAVPEDARRLYTRAQERLSRHDAPAAVRDLEEAVRRAPRFFEAWNALGVIAYHAERYEDAARHFRQALAAQPDADEPLVNLGGVLLNLGQWREALRYNQRAVAGQPGDALAHAQLGLSYLQLDQFAPAETHLREAVRLDPAHFSHPQLALADLYQRQGKDDAAREQWRAFLKLHPDTPQAARIREKLAAVR